jgi:hypothetical protein
MSLEKVKMQRKGKYAMQRKEEDCKDEPQDF